MVNIEKLTACLANELSVFARNHALWSNDAAMYVDVLVSGSEQTFLPKAFHSATPCQFLVPLSLLASTSALGTGRLSPDHVAAAHWLVLSPVAPSEAQ